MPWIPVDEDYDDDLDPFEGFDEDDYEERRISDALENCRCGAFFIGADGRLTQGADCVC